MNSLSPNLTIVAGRPVVSSLTVAAHFGKEHKNVLRDIRELLAHLPDELCALNFERTQDDCVLLTPSARLGHGWRPYSTWRPAATAVPSQGAAKERDLLFRRPCASPLGKGSYWRRHDVRVSARPRLRTAGERHAVAFFRAQIPTVRGAS
ncbi:Rha family transcriptional regulator [Desulfovibrio sp. TomC]|uniref:Rha family transcriptional regulator n=1 Tax=Desulfovibrio sp. TomC TaxID=1562888 RepID=UPI0012E16147|nr:Rha family transcriptional regulator [Desulfovibrio sp. TomC]